MPSDKVNKYASNVESSSCNVAVGVGSNGIGSHYNIMEKLKELYRELKGDKMCKEVSREIFVLGELAKIQSSKNS